MPRTCRGKPVAVLLLHFRRAKEDKEQVRDGSGHHVVYGSAAWLKLEAKAPPKK